MDHLDVPWSILGGFYGPLLVHTWYIVGKAINPLRHPGACLLKEAYCKVLKVLLDFRV